MTSTVLLALLNTLALGQAPSDPCEATAGHGGYTILLEESGHFVHCRGGQTTEEEPVSHERVVLQLPPEGPESPFRYRLFDPAHPEVGHRNPLLLRQREVIEEYQEILHDLANSPEPLHETLQHMEPAGEAAAPAGGGKPPAAAEAAPRQSPVTLAADAAQAKYLSYATPAFVDAVHALRRTYHRLERAANHLDLLCATSAPKVREGKLRARAQEICAASPGKAALSALAPFEVTLESFVEARTAARDAVLDLDLTPTSPAEQDAAARKATDALTAATRLAQKLVADAHASAGDLEHLVQDVDFLRAAVSLPATEEAMRLHLGRFSANGIFGAPDVYVVHVLKRPSQFLVEEGPAEAAAEKPEEREILVDRFQPASRNYVDIGLAVMYSAGLPDHPALAGQLGKQQLVQQQTAGFNGGVLVSLEPLEFTRIADPWAQLLHFPTIIIPFTIDPTHNYFIGAGLGIFDVASIDVGAHLSLTRVPAPGNSYGETFTTSPIDINHVTQAGPIAGGYFVSLSVDLVGVVHLIVDQLKPTVRDVQSNEPVGQVKP